jgi:hypothetical protein
MTRADPIDTAHAAKETAAHLREARAILRRLDRLDAAVRQSEAPTPALVAAARDAVDRLVHHLVRQEHTQQRVRQAIRRGGRG